MLGKGVLLENQFRHRPRFDPRSNASGYGERGERIRAGRAHCGDQRGAKIFRYLYRPALGAKFSMKRFHDLRLRTGTVPLAVLGQVIDADIAATLKP
jgi:hypothetical protein